MTQSGAGKRAAEQNADAPIQLQAETRNYRSAERKFHIPKSTLFDRVKPICNPLPSPNRNTFSKDK